MRLDELRQMIVDLGKGIHASLASVQPQEIALDASWFAWGSVSSHPDHLIRSAPGECLEEHLPPQAR
jgi:hypothetical protein